MAGLALFAPVVRGHSYMRQLFVEGQLKSGRPLVKDKDFEYREFRFSPAALAQMGKFDLREARLRPGQKVSIFVRSNAKPVQDCVQAWTAAGVEVARHGWEGLEPLLRHGLSDEYTLPDFTGLLNWLRKAVPASRATRPGARTGTGACCGRRAASRRRSASATATACSACSAVQIAALGGTVVLICNAGRDPHYGAARQGVALARRLAAGGIASLRMDFAGLGDSLGPPGKENVLSHIFQTDRGPDIHAALDALEQIGFRRFAAQGPLCRRLPCLPWRAGRAADHDAAAGQYSAVHPARRQCPGLPRATQPVAAPLPAQTGAPGELGRAVPGQAGCRRDDARPIHQCAHAAPQRHMASRGGSASCRCRASPARWTACQARRPERFFVFSPGEAEIEAFAREFGRTGDGLRSFNDVAVRIIPGMDHELSKVSGRYTAETFMIEFVAVHRPPEPVYPPRHRSAGRVTLPSASRARRPPSCRRQTASIRSAVLEQVRLVAEQQKKRLAPLTDELPLLESGLDSLCLAIIVANLEDELGLDPFGTGNDVAMPVTLGDCTTCRLSLYESCRG